MKEPTVEQEISDRQTQNAKLLRFFRDNPCVFFRQESLAEACGASLGAIRTRISEIKHDDSLGGELVSMPQSFLRDGKMHRGSKLWQFLPRPAQPLGRDAGTPIQQRSLFR